MIFQRGEEGEERGGLVIFVGFEGRSTLPWVVIRDFNDLAFQGELQLLQGHEDVY